MKKKLLYKLILLSFTTILVSYNADAQIAAKKTPKKSNTVVLFPAPRKTKRVMVTNQQSLPPGQAKKIYGTKSAKPFAPGQRKKATNNSWPNNPKHGKIKHQENDRNNNKKHDRH